MSKARSQKRKLIQKLETDPRVQSVVKPSTTRSRSAWNVKTEDTTKTIWVTYSKFAGDSTATNSPFFGTTWAAINGLRTDHSLYLVFLGKGDDLWTIPFADFVSRFYISEREDGDVWKFNFDRRNNREVLPEYQGIEPLFEY